jgi:hypothetical protein
MLAFCRLSSSLNHRLRPDKGFHFQLNRPEIVIAVRWRRLTEAALCLPFERPTSVFYWCSLDSDCPFFTVYQLIWIFVVTQFILDFGPLGLVNSEVTSSMDSAMLIL